MGAFETVVQVMAEMDVFTLFFPWLLVLATSYGILDKTGVISDDDMVNGITALALAFFAIGGAYLFLPSGILTQFAAVLTFGIFGIIGLIILMGIAGYDLENLEEKEDSLPLIAAILIFIVGFIGVIVSQLDVGSVVGGQSNTFEEVVMPILVLVFLALVILGVAGEGGEG